MLAHLLPLSGPRPLSLHLQGGRQLRKRASSQLSEDEPIPDSQPGSACGTDAKSDLDEPSASQVLVYEIPNLYAKFCVGQGACGHPSVSE